jgi:hypothetical protein
MTPAAQQQPTFPRIFTIRETPVMLDSDLAQLYGVTTASFNQAVVRKAGPFPSQSRDIDSSRSRRNIVERGFHQHKPPMLKIVKRLDEICWNLISLEVQKRTQPVFAAPARATP